MQFALSERGQHLQTIPSRKHKIQNDEAEFLGIHEEETFFSCGRDDDIIVLALQPFLQGAGDLDLVFYDQDACLPFFVVH